MIFSYIWTLWIPDKNSWRSFVTVTTWNNLEEEMPSFPKSTNFRVCWRTVQAQGNYAWVATMEKELEYTYAKQNICKIAKLLLFQPNWVQQFWQFLFVCFAHINFPYHLITFSYPNLVWNVSIQFARRTYQNLQNTGARVAKSFEKSFPKFRKISS